MRGRGERRKHKTCCSSCTSGKIFGHQVITGVSTSQGVTQKQYIQATPKQTCWISKVKSDRWPTVAPHCVSSLIAHRSHCSSSFLRWLACQWPFTQHTNIHLSPHKGKTEFSGNEFCLKYQLCSKNNLRALGGSSGKSLKQKDSVNAQTQHRKTTCLVALSMIWLVWEDYPGPVMDVYTDEAGLFKSSGRLQFSSSLLRTGVHQQYFNARYQVASARKSKSPSLSV